MSAEFFFLFFYLTPFLIFDTHFYFIFLFDTLFFSVQSSFKWHFALCFYPFLILNSLMSLFGVGTWLLYELMKLF